MRDSQDYHGFLEILTPTTAEGWVRDPSRPTAAVKVKAMLGEEILAEGIADLFRDDLIQAGIGLGLHGYLLKFSRRVQLNQLKEVDIVIGDPNLQRPAVLPSEGVRFFESEAKRWASASVVRQTDPTEAPIEGSVDRVSSMEIVGWARNPMASDHPVLLDISVNGELLGSCVTRVFRRDLQNKFMDHGCHGFHFEFPPHLGFSEIMTVQVTPRDAVSNIKKSKTTISGSPKGKILSRAFSEKLHSPLIYPSASSGVSDDVEAVEDTFLPAVSVCIIVLNRNGAHLLETLFTSFVENNTFLHVTWIIVDHGSTDPSETVCEGFRDRIQIEFHPRGGNYSFSVSNNYGANASQASRADYLLFLNNDIIWNEDFLPGMVSVLNDAAVGAVGLKLMDAFSWDGALKEGAIQHLGVHFNVDQSKKILRPYEMRSVATFERLDNSIRRVPAVTGACMLCRRNEFLKIGGFSEAYFYGYEDIDLCLKFRFQLNKEVVCDCGKSASHQRGFSRSGTNEALGRAIAGNQDILDQRWSRVVRECIGKQMFNALPFWTGRPLTIAVAVTEASAETSAGDYFTALELATAIHDLLTCHIVFLELKVNWYDLTGVDILVVMRDDYDLTKIESAPTHLKTIAWARNWFDRWCSRPWIDWYDEIWASSHTAKTFMERELAPRKIDLLPIATHWKRFHPTKDSWYPDNPHAPSDSFQIKRNRSNLSVESAVSGDYCFTGNFWQAPREIAFLLNPEEIPYGFSLYGIGWEQFPKFAPYHKGSVPYPELPTIYQNHRVLVDDANHVTKQWGSVNSRVFDAIAAGCLPITNAEIGSQELFDGRLPVYRNAAELNQLLMTYLEDEPLRRNTLKTLQDRVKAHHTYTHRAQQAVQLFRERGKTGRRLAILIAAPKKETVDEWGDYHFAMGLRYAMETLGISAKIFTMDAWYSSVAASCDAVLLLRGLSSYTPRPDQLNLMWNISHPDKVCDAEYNLYDHVFVASTGYAERLSARLDVPVTPLLQCTDARRFFIEKSHMDDPLGISFPLSINGEGEGHEKKEGYSEALDKSEEILSEEIFREKTPLLFVGNSRNEYRPIVKQAVKSDLPLHVYGTRWERFLPHHIIKGQYLPNDTLRHHYTTCQVLLNDHWETMRKRGFVSNRLFDAVACGAVVVSDAVEGLHELFGTAVTVVDPSQKLEQAVKQAIEVPWESRREASEYVLTHHTFVERAKEIASVLSCLIESRNDFSVLSDALSEV